MIYNQIVTWTAFAILAMFYHIVPAGFLWCEFSAKYCHFFPCNSPLSPFSSPPTKRSWSFLVFLSHSVVFSWPFLVFLSHSVYPPLGTIPSLGTPQASPRDIQTTCSEKFTLTFFFFPFLSMIKDELDIFSSGIFFVMPCIETYQKVGTLNLT